jgi:hypothetical protein
LAEALAGVALAGVMGLSPRDVKRSLQVAAYCTDFRHNGHGEIRRRRMNARPRSWSFRFSAMS